MKTAKEMSDIANNAIKNRVKEDVMKSITEKAEEGKFEVTIQRELDIKERLVLEELGYYVNCGDSIDGTYIDWDN